MRSNACAFALDAGHRVERVAVEHGVLAQHVRVAADGPERIADLVSDTGGETADAGDLLEMRALRLLLENARGHAIDAAGESRKFSWTSARHAPRQVALGDRFGRLDDRLERVEHEPLNLVRAERHENEDVGEDEEREIDRAVRAQRQRLEHERVEGGERERSGAENGEAEHHLGLEQCAELQRSDLWRSAGPFHRARRCWRNGGSHGWLNKGRASARSVARRADHGEG